MYQQRGREMNIGPMRILQLPSIVANQIAAGEVIERPASVVKELLENALDAHANTIHIEIGFGGLNQIKVSDDGVGIVAEDLPLAIQAHATSKIRQLNDLYRISSMGFRGEALASIAAISKCSISSKPKTEPHGMMLSMQGSGALKLTPCPRADGTTIDVCDLFFNAPVRKTFLKSPRSEFQAIEHVVKRFALSTHKLALTLSHNGKQVLNLPAAGCEKTKLERIKKILGKEFVEASVYLDIEHSGMRLMGWVSHHSYQRSQNDKQWVYLNQRMVKDKLINHAIKQAYEDLLHPGRYPTCLLYLTVPVQEVDVNVHPTKHEVRFQQPRLVHDFISSHISAALVAASSDVSKPRVTLGVREVVSPIFSEGSLSLSSLLKTRKEGYRIGEGMLKQSSESVRALQDFELQYDRESQSALKRPEWRLLNESFAVVFLSQGSYLVDVALLQQHRLFTLLSDEPLPLANRPLLVPVSFMIEPKDRLWFEQHSVVLRTLGIDLDWTSDKEVTVRTIPLLFPHLDLKKMLERIPGSVSLDQLSLFKLLVSCQGFDAHALKDEDKLHLFLYLEKQLLSDSTLSCCLALTRETCRELLEHVHCV